MSTSMSPEHVIKSYNCYVHDFFKKEEKFDDYKKTICNIMEYWFTSLTPSNTL